MERVAYVTFPAGLWHLTCTFVSQRFTATALWGHMTQASDPASIPFFSEEPLPH